MTMAQDKHTPEINDLLDSCADGPVHIARADSFDAVVMTADAYADLLDRVQSVETAEVLSDPLLSDSADEFGPKN
jgi:hypothetical protein